MVCCPKVSTSSYSGELVNEQHLEFRRSADKITLSSLRQLETISPYHLSALRPSYLCRLSWNLLKGKQSEIAAKGSSTPKPSKPLKLAEVRLHVNEVDGISAPSTDQLRIWLECYLLRKGDPLTINGSTSTIWVNVALTRDGADLLKVNPPDDRDPEGFV